jgi:glycosyltransferase involved in cell wall biosynthesis
MIRKINGKSIGTRSKERKHLLSKTPIILLCSLYGRSAMIQYASQLANALAKKAKVYMLIPDYTDKFFFDSKVNLIRIKAPPSVIKTAFLSTNPGHFSGIIKRIKHINPDVVHFLDNHPWYLFLLPHISNKTIFVTQHDIAAHPGEKIRGKIAIFVNRALNKKAGRVIVHGEKLKKELGLIIPENKILVFPYGSMEFFLRWKDERIKEEPNTILFFGRILHYKGLDILLKALKIVSKKMDYKLIIAGEGDLNPYRELLTKEIASNSEIINKYLPENEIPQYFQRASIVVMPYREASQSGIVPIIYAFKKALISSDVGALSEAIDNNKTGILIEPENPELLAEKIIYLLRNKEERKKLGRAGYIKMKKELGWDSIAARLLKEYQKALNKKAVK